MQGINCGVENKIELTAMTAPTNRVTIDKLDWALACLLTALAALPRLTYLDLAEFKLDEATHYQMAYSVTRGEWRWVGSMSSVGIPKPPLLVYMLALPMQLTQDPRVITGFLGLLAAFATGGFYLILRRFLGGGAAVGAALLFAMNPQAVLSARKLFTADLIPPLGTIFLAAATAFLTCSPKRVGWFAMLTALAFSLLLLNTFSPLLLLPALVTAFWQRRRELELRHYLGAILALALPLLPYLTVVQPQVGNAVRNTGNFVKIAPSSLRMVWNLLYGAPWPANGPGVAVIAALAIAVLSLIGVAWFLHAIRQQESRACATFLLSWLGLAPLLALVVPIALEMHHLVVLYPLLFMMPAAGVELVWHRSRWLGWGALFLLLIVAGWQIRTWVNILRDVSLGVEGYGTPLRYWWDTAQRARDLAAEHQASEVLLLMPGDQPWDEKAHILDALLSGTPHRVVNGYCTVLYPPHSAVFVIASEVSETLSLSTPCTQELGDPLPASPFGGTYHYRLWQPHYVEVSACTKKLQPASAQWASGVRLLGYGVEERVEPGETLRVYLLWETSRGPLNEDIHWFNHLLDREGHKWAQFDHVGWPAVRWQPGDQVLTQFRMSIDSGAGPSPYVLLVGQYTYPALENIPTLDRAGKPADYAIQLPLPLNDSVER